MKKKFILAITMIITASCLMSCNSNTDKESKNETNVEQAEETNNSNNDKEENSTASKSDESSKDSANKKSESKTSASSKGKKDTYKAKLDKIQVSLSDLDSEYSGNTVEMKHAASEEYERWDKALNEIYGELKKDLSKDKMAALEKEEAKWIKEKEDKASKAAEEYKGGTAEGLQHTASLAASTKERCYELVDKYMD